MRKILALLLALTTALCLCVPALAVSADTEPAGGGTAADPYRIGTAAELAAFRDMVNSGRTELCARLTADIVLDRTAEWTPIGNESACAYGGVFQGNGHTVSGLSVRAERESAGLFGYLSAEAAVKGLTVSDSAVAGRRFAGAVAGYSDGALSDCHATDTVQVKSGGSSGGIVGAMGQKADRITRCSNRGAVMVSAVSGGKAGGIVGSCGTIQMAECFNGGAVSAAGSGTLAAGGLIGGCGGAFAARLSDAYNVGRVSMTGIGSSGGLVGECSGELRVANTYQAGTVRGAAVAGLARGGMTLTNVYKLGTQPDKSGGSGTLTGSAVRLSAGALKKAAETLGDRFTGDSALTNGGYPLLAWQTAASAGTAAGAFAAAEAMAAEAAAPDEGAALSQESAALTLTTKEYLKLSDRTLLLVTYTGQTQEGRVPAYEGDPMCWSEKYQAYVCLTAEAAADVTDDKATMAEAAAGSLTYDGDVNGSGIVDINDAQLIYAIYNAQIDDSQLTQTQLLEADVNGDGVVDTNDAAYLMQRLMGA